MHTLAASRGWRFVDEQYLGSKHKYNWLCDQGHPVSMNYGNVRTGYGCTTCWAQRRLTLLGKMLAVAERNGWIVHSHPSKEEIVQNSSVEATCANGHRGIFAVTRVQSGFCRFCSKSELQKDWAKEHHFKALQLAAKNNGSVETSLQEIDDSATAQPSLKWKCSKGHIWNTGLSRLISQSKWCPQCEHGEDATIEDLKAHALERGGKCHSTDYVNGKTKYVWECSVGHIFKTDWFHVAYGTKTWCPQCSTSVSEQMCRYVLEQFLGCSFRSTRPSWLIGPKGNRLELDGYNEELAIAFEHHGEQHYRFCDFLHAGDKEKFRLQQERDEVKKLRCHEHGVTLVEIPQLDLSKDYAGIIKQIVDACSTHGVAISNVDFSLDLTPAFTNLHFEAIKQAIEGNGGKILQYSGISQRTKYQCRCGEIGHTSTRHVVRTLKNPGVCLSCLMKDVRDDQEPAKLAKNYEYVKSKFSGQCLRRGEECKWVFQCAEGHEFEAEMGNVRQGKWCPTCRQQELARKVKAKGEAAGFELLTPEPSMVGASQWRCCNGHEFERKASKILSTSRCPVCHVAQSSVKVLVPSKIHLQTTKDQKQEQVKNYIESRGGCVVAGSYESSRSVFTVDCGKGHQWQPTAVTLLKSNPSWCPHCAGRHKTNADLSVIAKTKDPHGVCHTPEYKGANVKHEWGCKNGHRWLATVSNVMSGYWCPECSGKKKGDMRKMQDIAQSLGGTCLSTEYLGAFRHLRWGCGTCGHEWDAMPTNVQRGKWCPPCGRAKGAEKRKLPR